MRLDVTQRFPGTPEEVLATLTEPTFVEHLGALPHIDRPELLEQHRSGTSVRQRVRYRFGGTLPPAVTAVIDPRKLSWIEETTFDLAASAATFRILPDHYADRLRCSGTHTVVAEGGDRCRRDIVAELSVRYPIVGRAVERAIAGGIEEHLADEAALVTRLLGSDDQP